MMQRRGATRAALAAFVALATLGPGSALAQPYGYQVGVPQSLYALQPYAPQPYAPQAYAPQAYAPGPYRPACCAVRAGTEVAVELAQAVGTRDKKAGDAFELRLAAPVIIDGQMAIPAGTKGVGRVVQSSGPGLGGKGAKLVVSAEYLNVKGGQIPLQGLQLTGAGKDNTFAADIASLGGWISMPLGLLGFAVPGGDIEIPAGTAASAKVARDVSLRPLGWAAPEDYDQIRAVFGERQQSRGWIQVPPPPPGMGQVVFYRAKTAAGFGLWFNVREDGQALGKLTNGGWFAVPLAPGDHQFSATLEPEFKDHLTLKVDPGETYYVEGTMTHGAVLGVANLAPSDKAHFDAVSRQLQATAAPDKAFARPGAG